MRPHYNRSELMVAACAFGAAAALAVVLSVHTTAPHDDGDEDSGLPGGPVVTREARAKGKAPELYPDVPLAKLATWTRPRATIRGTVTYVKHEADGDYHYRIEDGTGAFAIAEVIPELPLAVRPKVGDRVKVWGVARFDGQHKWGEVHPAVGIEVLARGD